jgi:hypothetical protein
MLVVASASALAADELRPAKPVELRPGINRGSLIGREGTPAAGELRFRTDDGEFRCAYDFRTYFDNEYQRISVVSLNPGDRLDLVTQHRQNRSGCYALVVHVNLPRSTSPRYSGPELRISRILPQGQLTFGGVVLQVNARSMVVRTNLAGRQVFHLSDSTSFLKQGGITRQSALAPNTRVFIRANRGFEDQLTAYQVVWVEDPFPR